MFDESYTKLELDDVASIIHEINKDVEGSIFDPLETTIMVIDVPFYDDYVFLDISDHATSPPLQRYAFQKKGVMEFTVLDWSYKVIYDLNLKVPIKLTEDNLIDYIRFFFGFVKGRHGRFIICENADSIKWKDEPPDEVRLALNTTIKPLKIIEKRKDGVFQVEAYMNLNDSIFKTMLYIEPNGRITMSDHEILIDDVPVIDSVLGN
ncbi:MAG: hypothetical protein OEY94_09765 [Alphaproteobacteria bacterium]|nr:hypothetical protein [Alphaproteobacteria bacterium]